MTEQVRLEAGYNLVGRKVMIGLPSYDYKVSSKLAISLANFCLLAMKHGVDVQICNISGCSVVSRVRNLIASDFLSSDCTDLMFIDSDINFDAEDIFRLLAWNSDPVKGIVAGIPVARKKGQVYFSTLDSDDDQNIFMDKMGLVRAKRVATAFMMIRRDVFTKLKEAHPEWIYYDEKKVGDEMICFFDFALKDNNYIGEDYLFCDRAREVGFEVWIDPTIKLGHMGTTEFQGSFGEEFLYPMIRPVDSNKEAA
jgi:hypothetical protein